MFLESYPLSAILHVITWVTRHALVSKLSPSSLFPLGKIFSLKHIVSFASFPCFWGVLFNNYLLFLQSSSEMSGCRVYLGRLPYKARERDVERFFKGFGRIRDIHLKEGFGFIVS